MDASPKGRTRGEKDKKYSLVCCMTNMKDVCRMQDADVEAMQQKMGEMHMDSRLVDIEAKIMQAIECKFAQWKQEMHKTFDARMEECLRSLKDKDDVIMQLQK